MNNLWKIVDSLPIFKFNNHIKCLDQFVQNLHTYQQLDYLLNQKVSQIAKTSFRSTGTYSDKGTGRRLGETVSKLVRTRDQIDFQALKQGANIFSTLLKRLCITTKYIKSKIYYSMYSWLFSQIHYQGANILQCTSRVLQACPNQGI